MERKSSEEMAREISRYVNNVCHEEDIRNFVKAMACEHRTLQQSFTRLCVAWLEDLGRREENHYDLRNEASVMLGKAFLELPIEKRRLPFV